MRIRDGADRVQSKLAVTSAMKFHNPDDIIFGKANKPSTPVKFVVQGDYGSASEISQRMKNEMNEQAMTKQRKYTGSRGHTRASTFAKGAIRDALVSQ